MTSDPRRPPGYPVVRTRVGRALHGEYAHHGRRVYRDLLGHLGYLRLVVFALEGRELSVEDGELLDDLAVAAHVPEPRVWPIKLSRVVAAEGRPLPGMVAALLALDSDTLGARIVERSARWLLEVTARTRDLEGDALARQLVAEVRAERIPGFGVPGRAVDERVTAIVASVERRGRAGRPHVALALRLAEAARRERGLEPNLALALGSTCLDLGLAPETAGIVTLCLLQTTMWANAREEAAAPSEAMRRLPTTTLRYTGPAPRESDAARRARAEPDHLPDRLPDPPGRAIARRLMASLPPRLPRGEQSELLRRIVARCKSVPGKPAPVVVFDLDGTLLDNRPRTSRILRELSETLSDEHAAERKILEAVDPEALAYLLTDSLTKLGVTRSEVVAQAELYWRDKFFKDDHLRYDVEVPGAVAFARACYEAGAVLVYFTGRDLPLMSLGSFRSLRDLGFPIGVPGTELVCKPDAQMPDEAYKRLEGPKLARVGEVVAIFDNEPANCNVLLAQNPAAESVLVDTQHLPGAPALDERVHVVGDFTMG